ncbi:hybrid sensor histidine kinase/response regulator [Gigaspora margarita]|uniref:Hybrid sensor histidine kinase/response regulator n=1 Tax=Gigaspora margarita TaxID=4874 RepID=A0A8H4EUM2_GIGMA|nr:hybrid sensor histidine kinase/response regulator [Gigaspora margarita]
MMTSLEGTTLTTEQKDMLNIISNAADIVLFIVNDVLNVAKLESKKFILIDMLPRYVKSDPERVKFTNEGEILLTISMQPREVIEENNDENSSYDQVYDKTCLGKFFTADMSITKKQDGAGLGLSICKNLVEINGGEIKVESKLGKGSKFSFTWNVELLLMSSLSTETQFNKQ